MRRAVTGRIYGKDPVYRRTVSLFVCFCFFYDNNNFLGYGKLEIQST